MNWQQVLLWAGGLSLLSVIAMIVGMPWVVTRLPRDYFNRSERVVWRTSSEEPFLTLVFILLKNLLGLVLVLLGAIMLVMPGQGVLTLLVGLLLMNFPGKYQLERWLVMRPGVLRALNWLRSRRGKLPFEDPINHSSVD